MMKKICVALMLMVACIAGATAADISGKWAGELAVQGMKLPLVLNLKSDGAGVSCTLNSPMQNAFGLPAQAEYLAPDSLVVNVTVIGATYQARLADDTLTGTFTQGGASLPLVLKRQPAEAVQPQEKKLYQEIDTLFAASDGTQLAGTLTLPVDRSEYPLVVMVTGSGPQNRDEELMGLKPFAVIADYLGQRGIASLRYDDRGVAGSKGDYAGSTLATFCSDAAAATAFARRVSGASKVGVLGHSEGGTIALMLAQEGVPDFIVSLAGVAVSGKETILDQNRRSLKAAHFSDAQIDSATRMLDSLFTALAAARHPSDVDIDAVITANSAGVPQQVIQLAKANAGSFNDYVLDLIRFDVRPGLSKVKCPVLALNGSLDTQVSAEPNLQAIRAGIPQAQTHLMPGLNHLLQHATTGAVAEYWTISETIAPEALELIGDFVEDISKKLK